MKKVLSFLAGLMLLSAPLYAETATETRIELYYPKVVPKNDAERAMLAFRDGKMELYRAMVDKYGPNIKVESDIFCSSILAMAIRKNDISEITRLISLGADTAICTNNPIGVAISQVRVEALKLLLAAGTPVDLPNNFGKRPLETALEIFPIFSNYDPQPKSSSRSLVEESIAIIALLVKHGAETSLKTKGGLSYADFFARQFAGKASSIHPDYEVYRREVLKLIDG